jgi:hypothetical protein
MEPVIPSVPTFTATIYVGTYNHTTKETHSLNKIRAVCEKYADEVGLCVTVTPTQFIYTNGGEKGAAVGLINYPRFPSIPEDIRAHALSLASRLLEALEQHRVSVVMPYETVMLSLKED